MTILQAIQSNPVFSDVNENSIQYLLDSRSIDGATVYSSDFIKEVELLSADLYLQISLLPEFSEGMLKIKYNKEDMRNRAKAIYLRYGDSKLSDFEPKTLNIGVNPLDD